jgi:hypothetical protein
MTEGARLTPVLHRHYQPRTLLLLPGMLALVALLLLISLLLPWHHRTIPASGYVVQYGYNVALWAPVLAVPVTWYAVRFSHWGFARYSRLWLTVTAILVAIFMWVDYLDASGEAASVYATAWYGPGFALGAAASLLLLIAGFVSWRTED